ncbi:flagellar radial spoke protein 3 [Chloropicon primus]|nr:flagellar radial spoke protein 3 [Chloropicon primus]
MVVATETYAYAAEPQPVRTRRRPKYRESDEPGGIPSNIMFDRRVVRGNTYAAQILPAEPLMETTGRPKKVVQTLKRASTPEPIDGRRHMDIQTDAYLEELTDTVPEAEISTQTDAFLDRPPTPRFIPMKTGVDMETQIESGEIFDFDLEVEPILEVLVGKTLEQGLMEVLEEEELEAMRTHQENFEQIRNAELIATQRMEAAEKRKEEEKQRRIEQEKQRLEREGQVRQKVAASSFARGFLDTVVEDVFADLHQAGHFYDPVEKEVQDTFLPWLLAETQSQLGNMEVSYNTAKSIVAAALKKKLDAQQKAEDARKAAIAKAKAEEEAKAAAEEKATEEAAKDAKEDAEDGEPKPEGDEEEAAA